MPPVIRLVQVILFINVHLFAESLSRDIVIYGEFSSNIRSSTSEENGPICGGGLSRPKTWRFDQ